MNKYLNMAAQAATKLVDKDGDGKISMAEFSKGMKDVAEKVAIPREIKPLYDGMHTCVDAASKFTKAREDLDTSVGSLQELLHLFDKIPSGPTRTALLAVKKTVITSLETVKGAEPVVMLLKSIKDKPDPPKSEPKAEPPPPSPPVASPAPAPPAVTPEPVAVAPPPSDDAAAATAAPPSDAVPMDVSAPPTADAPPSGGAS